MNNDSSNFESYLHMKFGAGQSLQKSDCERPQERVPQWSLMPSCASSSDLSSGPNKPPLTASSLALYGKFRYLLDLSSHNLSLLLHLSVVVMTIVIIT
jgi:hypothetical protein